MLIVLLWVGLNLAFPFVLLAAGWEQKLKRSLVSRFARRSQ